MTDARARNFVGSARAVIGKDVLELLSTAMYVDPLTIYREYVQNAADAIDDARRSGLLGRGEPGRIAITIDPSSRTVAIRDNGSGIPADRFEAVLTAIGASAKRGTGARGFRGVGRLSGLAYARELTFRSRAAGEHIVSGVTWDCRALRTALRDTGDGHRDLASVIGDITTAFVEGAENVGEERFFEVALTGVPRQGDDRLMSADAVSDYLAQVAPVPFSPTFRLAEVIVDRLRPFSPAPALEITVNGSAPLSRPFEEEIAVTGGRPLALRDASFVEVPGVDGGVAAVAWIAHHGYEGAIHPSTLVRGLRARVGDVQVGDGSVFEDIFPETRFNAWTVGEVHVFDARIVPNGRRDDFERNVHLANLKNHLAPLGREVAVRCRISSRERKRMRDMELEHAAAHEALAVLQQGGLGTDARADLVASVERGLRRLETLVGAAGPVGEDRPEQRERIEAVRERMAALGAESAGGSPLDSLPADRRAWYEEMFELIYACSANRSAAKALVGRIMAKVV